MIKNKSNNSSWHRSNHIFSINATIITIIIASLATLSTAAVQCNIGLKMFSSESGNAICAPLPTHFNCIESCEWNTSCALSTHYAAFRGRRTYLSGMVLTGSTFIVQCCASLGTIVEMNTRKEPKCVWVPIIETVEERGSMRFDPPLSPNEYVRDVIAERLEKGRVNLRVQICKFIVQRSNCTRDQMTQEDANFHQLLLLRLNRTKELLSQGKLSSSLSPSATDQFRDEKPILTPIQIPHHRHQLPQAPLRLQSPVIQASLPSLPMTDISEKASIVMGDSDHKANQQSPLVFDSPELRTNESSGTFLQFLSDSVSISLQNTSTHRDQPLPINEPKVFASNNKNNDAAISPRYHTLRLPKSLRRIDFKPITDSPEKQFRESNSPLFNDDPISVAMASPSYNIQHRFHNQFGSTDNGLRGIAASNTWHQRNWPLPLQNVSLHQELIPTSYWRRLVNNHQKLDRNTNENTNTSPHNLAVIERQIPIAENDELTLKNVFHTEKTKIPMRVKHHQQNYLESENDFPIINTNTDLGHDGHINRHYRTDVNNKLSHSGAIRQLNYSNTTNAILRRPFTSLSHRQRQFRIQKLRHDRHQSQQPQEQINRRIENKSDEFTYRHLISQSNKKQHINELQHRSIADMNREKSSVIALNGLFTCCQQQAPGCKHLCSKDVTKEEIKNALVTQQCPPLSMTSVIQCFPRYYNITSVTRCCNANSQRHTSSLTLANSVGKLPDQCLGLCAPDFKLSFAHFACIDHISTIVECYRDLLQ